MSLFNAKAATPVSTFSGTDVFPFGSDALGWNVITGTDLGTTLGGLSGYAILAAANVFTAGQTVATAGLGSGQLTLKDTSATGVNSAALVNFVDSAGTLQAYLLKQATSGDLLIGNSSAGTIRFLANSYEAARFLPTGATVLNYTAGFDPSAVVLTVTASTSQSANIQEWVDEFGAVNGRINFSGQFTNPSGGGGSEAFGNSASAPNIDATAFGYNAHAGGTNSIAFGSGSIANGTGSIALGKSATAGTFQNAVALGASAGAGANGRFTFYSGAFDPSFTLARNTTLFQRPVGGLFGSWAVTADGSREGSVGLAAYYIGNLQTGVTVRANSGGVAYLGFFGATPVAQQTLPSAGTVTAADIRTALINLGLCV